MNRLSLCPRPLGDTLFRQRNSPDVFMVNLCFNFAELCVPQGTFSGCAIHLVLCGKRFCSLLSCAAKKEAKKAARRLTALRVLSTARENGRDYAASPRFPACLGSQPIGVNVKTDPYFFVLSCLCGESAASFRNRSEYGMIGHQTNHVLEGVL